MVRQITFAIEWVYFTAIKSNSTTSPSAKDLEKMGLKMGWIEGGMDGWINVTRGVWLAKRF